MTGLVLVIPGRPVPWARAGTKGSRRFIPEKQQAHKDWVHLEAVALMRARRWAKVTAPVRVDVEFVYRTPKRGAVDGQLRTGRPDLDNLIKQILDSLNGAVWADDAQVVEIAARKVYGPDEATRIHVAWVDGRDAA